LSFSIGINWRGIEDYRDKSGALNLIKTKIIIGKSIMKICFPVTHDGNTTIIELELPDGTISDSVFVLALAEMLRNAPKPIADATGVRLGDEVGMSGEYKKDTVTTLANSGNARTGMWWGTYPRPPAGAATVALCSQDEELYVALVYAPWLGVQPNGKPVEHGPNPASFRIPEGWYRPPADANTNSISMRSDKEMELAERKMPNEAAYRDTPRFDHTSYPNDQTTCDCARRELYSRTGLDISKTQFDQVTVLEKTAPENKRGMLAIYQIELSSLVRLDPVDKQKASHAAWGKISDITLAKSEQNTLLININYDSKPVPIDMHYALIIAMGVEKYRDKQILARSEKQHSSREQIEARIKLILRNSNFNPEQGLIDLLGISSEAYFMQQFNDIALPTAEQGETKSKAALLSALGDYAEKYHQKILAVTDLFAKQSLITVEDMRKAIAEIKDRRSTLKF
jgi:hypothetical protein